LDGKKFKLKNLLLSKLSRKITILFMIVGIIFPSFAVYYFYITIINIAPETLTSETEILFRNSLILIVILLTINAVIIGFLFSKSVIKSLKKLYKATKEIEKGNFDVHLEIFTRDEIQELADALNQTISTLAKKQEEVKGIDYAKTEFLSMTSHELRNPMTPMKAQLQMLEENYFGKLSDKQKESIKIITRNADRLDKIISDFLEISRLETARLKFNFRETDIAQLIKEIVQFMEGFLKEKNIKLETNIEKLPIIKADPDRVSQVLRNLINNAIKFSNEKSKIDITAKLKNNQILFSVIDYGCGLTPDDQIRIFEPFYQVESTNHQRHDGTGLGLSICRGIVESQKGRIWVESKPGAGSKFYFTLPLCPVREIEPIKVLFSQKGVIKKKICQ
jgi:signal transduction histidine kinase